MEIRDKLTKLERSIREIDQLVDELASSLQAHKLKVENKEKKISSLKEVVKSNVDKIDKIIEDYNASS